MIKKLLDFFWPVLPYVSSVGEIMRVTPHEFVWVGPVHPEGSDSGVPDFESESVAVRATSGFFWPFELTICRDAKGVVTVSSYFQDSISVNWRERRILSRALSDWQEWYCFEARQSDEPAWASFLQDLPEKKPVIVTLVGPSCSGKSHTEKALVARGYGKAVSHTTRPARPGEVHQVDYHFVTREEMRAAHEAGKMVEIAEFDGNLYGLSADALQEASKLSADGTVVIVTEPAGAAKIEAYGRDNNIPVVNVWLCCPPKEQARRFVERVGGYKSEAIADRMAAMLDEEAKWKLEAHLGNIYNSSIPFDLYFWNVGEKCNAYLDAIDQAVQRRRPA